MKVILSKQLISEISEISRIENDFYEEINQRKTSSNKLSKYVTAFDYIDKILIVLGAASGGVSIALFMSVIGAPVGIASASFTLIFSLTREIIKKLLSITRNKKKKHNKIFMLAKSKLSSIEALVSQALIDMEISHGEFTSIFKEKDKYEKMKENVRNVSEKPKETNEIMKLNSVNSKSYKTNCVKTTKINKHLCHQKTLFFWVCVMSSNE